MSSENDDVKPLEDNAKSAVPSRNASVRGGAKRSKNGGKNRKRPEKRGEPSS